MGGKGDGIRAYPEEHEAIPIIVRQNPGETIQVVSNGPCETLLRIGGKPEG